MFAKMTAIATIVSSVGLCGDAIAQANAFCDNFRDIAFNEVSTTQFSESYDAAYDAIAQLIKSSESFQTLRESVSNAGADASFKLFSSGYQQQTGQTLSESNYRSALNDFSREMFRESSRRRSETGFHRTFVPELRQAAELCASAGTVSEPRLIAEITDHGNGDTSIMTITAYTTGLGDQAISNISYLPSNLDANCTASTGVFRNRTTFACSRSVNRELAITIAWANKGNAFGTNVIRWPAREEIDPKIPTWSAFSDLSNCREYHWGRGSPLARLTVSASSDVVFSSGSESIDRILYICEVATDGIEELTMSADRYNLALSIEDGETSTEPSSGGGAGFGFLILGDGLDPDDLFEANSDDPEYDLAACRLVVGQKVQGGPRVSSGSVRSLTCRVDPGEPVYAGVYAADSWKSRSVSTEVTAVQLLAAPAQ